MGYKIGSFNMKNFSFTADKNIEKIAEIIKKERFDIVALQEILSEGKGIEKRVLRVMPSKWKFVFVPANSSLDNRGEGYGFLWNSDKVDLVESNDNPTVIMNRKYDLARKPAYARFTSINKIGGCFCELRILCVHLYFGSNSSVDVQKRLYEHEIITKYIYPSVADKRYGNNMPAYTILLGDYNLNIKHHSNNGPFLTDVITVSDQGHIKQMVTVQKDKTSLKSGETSSENDIEIYANNYDHFTYDANRFSGVKVSNNRVDAVSKFYENDRDKYNKEISDHVPISMNLNLK